MPGSRARTQLADGPGRRFADVRWVAETGSTNSDVMEMARQGEPEGVVLVTDHQTACRGRAGRTWAAPPGAGLLLSILLRPPAAVAEACTMVVGLAAAAAVERTAGFVPRLKWPNDLVWPGDGTSPDRKLAGILAEADWPPGSTPSGGARTPGPADRLVVVVGIGINVTWPEDLPEELAEVAVACNHVVDRPLDREELLIALLEEMGPRYDDLRAGRVGMIREEWRAKSATIGRRVRIDLGRDDFVGTAVDITDAGHLQVQTLEGDTRTFAVGDVVHLRPEG